MAEKKKESIAEQIDFERKREYMRKIKNKKKKKKDGTRSFKDMIKGISKNLGI